MISLSSEELVKDMGGYLGDYTSMAFASPFEVFYFRMKDWEYGGENYTISRGFLFSALAGAF
jgi:hypothetical protein